MSRAGDPVGSTVQQSKVNRSPQRTQIYLVLPDSDKVAIGGELAPILDLELTACCLQRLGNSDDNGAIAGSGLQILCNYVQSRDVAFVIENNVFLARDLGADGVHYSLAGHAQETDPVLPNFEHGRSVLDADPIIGAMTDGSKHQAMMAGEQMVSYLGFCKSYEGQNSGDFELMKWWNENFVVPSVAFGINSDEDLDLALTSGADFVSLELAKDANISETIEQAQHVAEKIENFFGSGDRPD